MSRADSITVFAEGTFEEQIQDLVNYIIRGRSDEERAEAIRPFQEALKSSDGAGLDKERQKKVFSMALAEVKGFGDGSEKEIEGFFNLIYGHLFTLYDNDSPELAEYTSKLVSAITGSSTDHASLKYRILSNLFNTIDQHSILRLTVYTALLDLASENDDLDVLQPTQQKISKWLSEWNVSSEQSSQLWKKISDAYRKAGEPTKSYEYELSYVRSIPSSSPDAPSAGAEIMAVALRLPTLFDFDPLFKLDAVIAAKDHELFQLLHIFLTGGLSEYQAWEASHSDAFEKYQLDKEQLGHKIRLLSLAALAFQHVGQDLPYAQIAQTIQVDESDVEKWGIDVIRVGLVSGKLSQTSRTMHIIRSTARTFEKDQWQGLEKRLVAWKSGLTSILEVISNAKRQGGNPTAAHLAVPFYYSSGTGCQHKVKESIPTPQGWTKYAPAPAHHTITLRVALSQPRFSLLEQHLVEISDPSHSRYGQHLSQAEVDELSAPHEESTRLVDQWLSGYGILDSDISRSSSNDSVSFTVPVRLAEQMLDTKYNIWRHDDDEYILRTTSYSLPENLHSHVDIVQPTTLFARWKGMKSHLFFESEEFKTEDIASPLMHVNNFQVLTGDLPAGPVDPHCNFTITVNCLSQMYNLLGYVPQVPHAQKIGITGYLDQYANIEDLQEFYRMQRPEAVNSTFEFRSVNGGINSQVLEAAGSEANLDVQYAFGLAHPIPGVFWSTPGSPPFQADHVTTRNTNEPYQVWLDHMSSDPSPPAVISTSYGDSEQTVPVTYAERVCRDFMKLTSRGVSLIFASGDNGVGDGNPDPNTQKCYSNDGRNVRRFSPLFPATCPYVTAVGGTNGYPETAVYFSGGGFSNYFARPYYQNEAVLGYLNKLGDIYRGLFNPGGRAIPDVAAQGRHYAIHVKGKWASIGGTSAAAPVFAAVISLLNDARLAQGKPVLGFLNPALYSHAIPGLHDVTSGNNPGCGTPGFFAADGWDPVTGLGTPNFIKLKELLIDYVENPAAIAQILS
ncbi:hypothetical protein ONZ45_g6838 [Pleurotus djamor]|nr:hypothetical protein ONZ45_g6838 [Pleurotus djamor]